MNYRDWCALKMKIISTSLSSSDIENKTFDKYEPIPENKKAVELLKKWTPEQKTGALLYGRNGTGKTHILKALCIKWGCRDYRTLLLSSQTILQIIRGNFEIKDRSIPDYEIVPMLVIDDLGAEYLTEWGNASLLSIIEKRLNYGKTTFVSTNLDANELFKRYGTRMIDRLRELLFFMEIKGDSYREKISKQRIEKWPNL